MKKVLVLAVLAVFSSLYTNVWGTTWKQGGVKIVSSGSTLTVSAIDPEGEGTRGVMEDYVDFDGSSSPKRPSTWSFGFTTIIVEEGVTTIGAYAFQGITNITTVKLPASLTSIRTDAFKGCTDVTSFYYAGSPTEWASNISFSNLTAHPCGARTKGTDYYFYGYSAPRTDLLIIEPTITEINPYAFYRIYLHTGTSGLGIPGTVTKIGTKAFYGATLSGEITVNKATAPTLETDALNTVSTGMTIHVPSGASGYTSANGWNRFTTVTTHPISGSDVGSEISTTTKITWNLSESGVLTLNATGATKTITGIDGASSLPWRYFRRLVYTVKLQGEISAIGNMLHYNYGLGGIELDQTTIPSVSATYIATSSSTAYNALANPLSNLTLRVKQKTLVNDTETAKFSSAPWNDGKWDIGLAETATFSDVKNVANTDTLEAIKEYIDLPFSLQLKRTLSNAYYNTFCSPIPISAEQIESIWGEGSYAHEFTGTEYDEEKDSLTLHFSEEIASIAAGVPYLIQPTNNVANPTFSNVAPSSIVTEPATIKPEDAAASFVGTILSENVTDEWAEAENFIFLQADNKLTFATTGTLRGMRAYFLLDEDVSAGALAKAPGMRIGRSQNTATAIDQTPEQKSLNATKILRNGQLIIVREDTEYNAFGVRIQ